MTKLTGLSGSLRQRSFNSSLLRAAVELMPQGAEMTVSFHLVTFRSTTATWRPRKAFPGLCRSSRTQSPPRTGCSL